MKEITTNQPIGSTVSDTSFSPFKESNSHEFTEGKISVGDREYLYIYCKKCGIVSYDQMFKSRSYESKYVPSKCL